MIAQIRSQQFAVKRLGIHHLIMYYVAKKELPRYHVIHK